MTTEWLFNNQEVRHTHTHTVTCSDILCSFHTFSSILWCFLYFSFHHSFCFFRPFLFLSLFFDVTFVSFLLSLHFSPTFWLLDTNVYVCACLTLCQLKLTKSLQLRLLHLLVDWRSLALLSLPRFHPEVSLTPFSCSIWDSHLTALSSFFIPMPARRQEAAGQWSNINVVSLSVGDLVDISRGVTHKCTHTHLQTHTGGKNTSTIKQQKR